MRLGLGYEKGPCLVESDISRTPLGPLGEPRFVLGNYKNSFLQAVLAAAIPHPGGQTLSQHQQDQPVHVDTTPQLLQKPWQPLAAPVILLAARFGKCSRAASESRVGSQLNLPLKFTLLEFQKRTRTPPLLPSQAHGTEPDFQCV